MPSKSAKRVPQHTPDEVNDEIHRRLEANVAYFATRLDRIEQRIDELDREWDIERTLEANAAAVSLFGLAMGTFSNRKWFALPAVVGSFLLQHAIQGWCPPVSIFRRLGFRTRTEIDQERYALKAVRGDFEGIGGDGDGVEKALSATST